MVAVPEATAAAYKGSSNDIQQKIRRVVDVWRQRHVFEGPILDAVEARVNGETGMPRSSWKYALRHTTNPSCY